MSNQIKKALEKKRKTYTADEEYESCALHIKDIVEELESSNFTNIREVLGMFLNLEVERAVGTMVALAGSTKPEGDMPSNSRKFYRELKKNKKILAQDDSMRSYKNKASTLDF